MDLLFNDFKTGVFNEERTPCLSLYQPTHRGFPDKQQDPIRFGNLVRELENSLAQADSPVDTGPLLDPFRALADDTDFWRTQTLDGLAVLAAPGLFRVYRLQRPVPELAIVADSFHMKPLFRILQSADNYYVMCLERQEIRLFEGNRDQLDEIQLSEGFPRTSDDLVDDEDTERHFSTFTPRAGTSSMVLFGKGGKSDVEDTETERFFRSVDQAVLDRYSHPSERPLLLAALPENITEFRRVSRNPFLLENEISVGPSSLTPEELRELAWRAFEPTYLERLAALIESFNEANAHERGDADIANVARNAVAGRVATLLIDADLSVPGKIDPGTGEVRYEELSDPTVDDLLDDLGQIVLKQGGDIVIVPADRMPTDTGVAAIYRF